MSLPFSLSSAPQLHSVVCAHGLHGTLTGVYTGFGLSYTTFTYSPKSDQPSGRISLAPVRDMLAATKDSGRTFPSSDLLAAAAPMVNYYVNVSNTGKMDADDVVLGFMVPPGAGTNVSSVATCLTQFTVQYNTAAAELAKTSCVCYRACHSRRCLRSSASMSRPARQSP
jgi:hypothetical protein